MPALIAQPDALRNESQRTAAPVRGDESRGASRLQGIPLLLIIGAAAFYLVATFKIATSKEPFIDEGWFASPAYNLAFHGFMGTSVLEPTGSWLKGDLKGIREYTYWVMPLHLLAQAAWYRIFGFGIIQMRLLSVAWGAIALAAWYFIVERLTRNSLAGVLTFCLLALDFTFLWSAGEGRMDMMCVGLGSAALATYLLLREKNFLWAFLSANCLAAASVFTHPNGVVWVCFLAMLALLYDRRRLRLRVLAAGFAPYAALLAGWAGYIAKRPDYFVAQFAANLHLPDGTRGSGFSHPLIAIQKEVKRYVAHFTVGNWAKPLPHYGILIPILLGAISIAAAIRFLRTREKGLGTILLLLAVCLALMTFGDPGKAHYYLAMIMPLYAATAAVWLSGGELKGAWFYLRCGMIVCLVLLQVDMLNANLVYNPLRDNFEPTAAFLKSLPNSQITADAVFAFELPDRINDDMRLGMYSGHKPDVFVVDAGYASTWKNIFPQYDPETVAYVRNMILNDYHCIFATDGYTVYKRNDVSSAEPQLTGLATGQ